MKLSQKVALRFIRAKFKLIAAISKKKAGKMAFVLFCTPQRRNLKKPSAIFKKAENLQFNMSTTLIKGWRWNHPSSNKVLILHGFESSAVNFDRYIAAFYKKGYEVLAFDAPAHGHSGGNKINAPLYKKMIQEINIQYGPVNYFLAHSFGGLALSLALEEMEHSHENKVVFIAPATETATSVDLFCQLLRVDNGVKEEMLKEINRAGGKDINWYSIKRAMKNIKAQVLWIHDKEDTITPLKDALAVKKENYNNLTFEITDGLGHRMIYRDKVVFNRITEFFIED